jgi:FixJ family two-component response regulator
MSASAGKVFLVDDDPAVITSLTRLLAASDFEVLSFHSAEAFLLAHDDSLPGCAVLDVAMPELNGIDLQARLSARGCERPIVFLTGHGDIPTSVQAMKSGAVDFLTKPVAEERLLAAIRLALDKDREIRAVRVERAKMAARYQRLTPRESEIFRFVISGLLNKQIAGELGMAVKTVKVHRARVMSKMSVRSVAELVRAALILGISPATSRGALAGAA